MSTADPGADRPSDRNAIVFGAGFTGSSSAGARSTVIDARGSSRAFEVPSGSTAVLAGLTVTGGSAASGGGAFVASGAQLSVYAAIFRGNVATDRGGAISNAGNALGLQLDALGQPRRGRRRAGQRR